MRKETCNLLVLGRKDDIETDEDKLLDGYEYLGFDTEQRYGDRFIVNTSDGVYWVGYDSTYQCYFVAEEDAEVFASPPDKAYIRHSESPADIVDWFQDK